MATKTQFSPLSFLVLFALAASDVLGGDSHEHEQEHREHGAHVHGIAALNLALEGSEMHLELNSPAANIVGFEHAPSSEADHAALDTAVAALKDGARLFEFDDDAGCSMEDARIASSLMEDYHGKHEREARSDRAHEGHEHEGETHTDVEAVYRFTCANPAGLTQLSVELFDIFPGMERLKVQFVIESKQGAAELTAADHVVKF